MSSKGIIGIIPAGGIASRLSPISCSKEVFPVGWKEKSQTPKVMANYLIEYMSKGGAERIYCIIKEGKWDIPAYFKDGSLFGNKIAYLIADLPYGVPFTVNQATPFINEETVLFGFPDMILSPDNAFESIVKKFNQGAADVVLGAFKVDNHQKWDLIIANEQDEVTDIHIKPMEKLSAYAWAIACWSKKFTAFINDFCLKTIEAVKEDGARIKDFHLGDCLKAGMSAGLKIEVVKFQDGFARDLGTLADLKTIIKENASIS